MSLGKLKDLRIVFDEVRAQRTVYFINCLKHTKGRWRGQPFDLQPWQDSIIRDVFATVKENGYRQYNTVYVEIPKKNGKSELAAGVALYMTCGDNEWGAEVYGCASDRQQASIVFDELHSQPNRELFDIMTKGSGDARTQPLFSRLAQQGRTAIPYVLNSTRKQRISS